MQLQLQINFRLRRIEKIFLLGTGFHCTMVLPLPAQHREKLISMERPKQRQIKDILITLQQNLACQNSILNLRLRLYKLAIQLPKSTKIIAVSVCKTFCQSSKGSVTKIVSSRSGEVDTSATGQSINSSILRTYLIALAGKSAHDLAPSVLSSQPDISS